MVNRLSISPSDDDLAMLAAIQRDISAKQGIEVGQTAVIRKLIRDEFQRRKLQKEKPRPKPELGK